MRVIVMIDKIKGIYSKVLCRKKKVKDKNEKYNYKDFKGYTMTDEGGKNLILLVDFIGDAMAESGTITMGHCLDKIKAEATNWQQMALVDRLVEVGVLAEVKQFRKPIEYNRIFRKARVTT